MKQFLTNLSKGIILGASISIFSIIILNSSKLTNNTEAASNVSIYLERDFSNTQDLEILTRLKNPTEPKAPPPPRDARAIKLEKFLKNKGSYLSKYTDLIVQLSDTYGVDYRLPVAIAGAESTYCQVNFKANNCWGYGGYAWASEETGIREYMKLMNKNYFSKGLKNINSIGPVYNPGNADGYTKKVQGIISQIP